jgi:hypothetical protein
MNPDELEVMIKSFLITYDYDASTDLIINADKYKIKFNTIQDS